MPKPYAKVAQKATHLNFWSRIKIKNRLIRDKLPNLATLPLWGIRI